MTVLGSRNLTLLGSMISNNTASGVVLTGATGATLGSSAAPNTISRNRLFGIFATGFLGGTTLRSSTISQNGSTGVSLAAVGLVTAPTG